MILETKLLKNEKHQTRVNLSRVWCFSFLSSLVSEIKAATKRELAQTQHQRHFRLNESI